VSQSIARVAAKLRDADTITRDVSEIAQSVQASAARVDASLRSFTASS
jgi:hypothetical protein